MLSDLSAFLKAFLLKMENSTELKLENRARVNTYNLQLEGRVGLQLF